MKNFGEVYLPNINMKKTVPNVIFVQEIQHNTIPQESDVYKNSFKKEAVYEYLKPFLHLFRITGFFLLKKPEPGVTFFHLLSFPMLYSVLIYILTGYGIYVLTRKILFSTSGTHVNSFEYSVLEYNFLLFLIPHFTLHPANWRQQKRIAAHIRSWWIFQNKYEELTHQKFSLGSAGYAWFLTVFWFSILALNTVYISTFLGKLHDWMALLYSYLVTSLLLHVIFCHLLCDSLKCATAQMSKSFQKLWEENISPELIIECRELWQHLSDLAVNTGNATGCTMNQVILVGFITSILSVYGVMALFILGAMSIQCVGIIIHCAVWLTVMYFICNCGHSTSAKVGGTFIKQLGLLYKNQSDSVKMEIDRFLQMINSNHPTISFLGFVTVNRHLFVSLCSTMVTYLVVLIQFRKQDAEATRNATSSI